MSHPVADILTEAAKLNDGDDRRRGGTLHLEGDCDMIVAGDIHGDRANLARIVGYAGLGRDPSVRLVLQEIIHGPPDARSGHDRSIEVLLRAARLKVAHPREVLFLLGNHDVAEVTGNEITRDGQPSLRTFHSGVAFAFPDAAEEVMAGLKQFLSSLPVAIRCPNNVLLSHSLPAPGRMSQACLDVLDRPYRPEDFKRGGGLYEWTWGRGHTPEHVDELAAALGVDIFVFGHLHTPDGFNWVSPRAVSLASNHSQGCLMRFPTASPLTREAAQAAIKPLATLGA